ncbi:MAG: hypothetical protein EOO08_12235 [Chitinophagaceae bacterium]|nr:MAG: hypothetical protein EOO08_12235 [Chitinophagaceae bacterium]
MKKFLSAALLFLCAHAVSGQATEGTIKVSRELQQAAVIQLPYPSEIVTDALADYLSKKGRSKATNIKGFTAFRNLQPVGNADGNADLYFKAERKSRQEKGSAVLYLLLTAPKEGDGAGANLHYLTMEEAKAYLNTLVPAIEAYNLEQNIREQNAVIIKAEDRYKDLAADGVALDRKKLAIEKSITENQTALQSQEREVALQKQKLAGLVGLRKN